MIQGKRVIVVLPAFNAGRTLERTVAGIPRRLVDDILLVDDASSDETVQLSQRLGLKTYRHLRNQGYGANQKTCYSQALALKADIVVMLHPDYQYDPHLIPELVHPIAAGRCDVVLGSRILGGQALQGGMPRYKYLANRLLTRLQNRALGLNLSEFHTGYRAYSRDVLERLPLQEDSNDFLFDNQILTQAHWFRFRIGEVACPARYFEEASTIGFWRACRYGLGVLKTTLAYWRARQGWSTPRLFSENGRRLEIDRSAVAVPR